MKDKLKGLIVGVTVGALMATSSAVAFTGVVQKELHYNNIKVTLDGKNVDTVTASGNYVEPFIIDGTTYLPVRAVANAVGLDVNWNQNTSTVELTTKSEATVPGNENVDKTVTTPPVVKEKVVLNKNDIKIIYKGYEFDDGDLILHFTGENNSDETVVIQTRDESVNGYMVFSLNSETITPGKKANFDVEFNSWDLEEYNITTMEEVEFYFSIAVEESAYKYSDIYETKTITIKASDLK